MASEIYENHTEVSFSDLHGSKNEVYFKDLNIKVKFYDSSIYITDLENAGKRGKMVNIFCISTWARWGAGCTLYNFLNEITDREGIKTLFEGLKAEFQAGAYEDQGNGYYKGFEEDYQDHKGENHNISFSLSASKGVHVFSPFAQVKPLKKLPPKFTKVHVDKLLKNRQYDSVIEYYHFDGMVDMCTYNDYEVSNVDSLIQDVNGSDFRFSYEAEEKTLYIRNAAVGYKVKVNLNA